MSALTVVVPATDDPPTLDRCRAAIAAAADPPDEVIVVEGPSELSASGARNAGVARATGDVIVFVDADVEVHPDAFTRIRSSFAEFPDLAALFGSYDDEPDHPGLVSRFRNLLHHHVHQAGAGSADTFWTGLGAIRRDRFLALGGFDEERYPHPSIEDIDLGDRLRAEGDRVVLDPSVQGTHLKRWTLRSMLWTDFARRAIPWIALQVRTRRPAGSLNCGWRHRLSALACLLVPVAAVLGAPALVLAAVGAFVGLNLGFYALLARQLGLLPAAGGVVLHGLHHAVAVLAVPVGIAVAVVALASTWRRREVLTVATVEGPSQ